VKENTYEDQFADAIRLFWELRGRQLQEQADRDKSDTGLRGAVTAGKHLNPIAGILEQAVEHAGVVMESGSRTLPGFYRATFHFLVNPRAWAKVPAETRATVVDFVRNVDPPAYEASWDKRLDSGYADLKETGVKAVRFSSEEEKKFSKTVLEAAWAAVRKKAPEEGKRLQAMLMK